MNSLKIKDIQDGQLIDGVYLVKEMGRAETKAGKPYLTLTLMDQSGEIGARVWDQADRLAAECAAGTVVSVQALAQSYKGILQLKVNDLAASPDTDPGLFMPSAPGNLKVMTTELLKLVKSVEDSDLNNLLMALFRSRRFFDLFKKAPAAKFMHHAYSGGLLEHTLGVTRLADMVATLYPALDRSLLISGALLHDIGKIKEFSFDSFPFDYSDQGRLVGHMVLGVEMIQEKIAELPGFPAETGARLKHLILSHHGSHEFGSPVLPMMLEAFILNFIDDLDAKVNYITRLAGQARQEGYQWSEFQRNLNRFLMLRGNPHAQTEGNNEPMPDDFDPRQGSLWG